MSSLEMPLLARSAELAPRKTDRVPRVSNLENATSVCGLRAWLPLGDLWRRRRKGCATLRALAVTRCATRCAPGVEELECAGLRGETQAKRVKDYRPGARRATGNLSRRRNQTATKIAGQTVSASLECDQKRQKCGRLTPE